MLLADAEVDRITDFIQRQVKAAGAKGVVIGISGGIDSALVAKLCVMALGKERVYGLLLPCGTQPLGDDTLVVKHLGLPLTRTIQVGGACVDLARWTGATERIPFGNVQARVRMTCLYAYANIHNLLVAGTTNRSEMLTGYFTKYGDGGVDFEPIAHLYKTEVWELARRLRLPKKIIGKEPSAELWEGQTDEGELGISYEKLDRVLSLLADSVLDYQGRPELVGELAKVKREDVERVIKIVAKARHKLKMPPKIE